MAIDVSPTEFVETYSFWKVLALETVIAACAVVPLLPNISDGLVYTAFWYTPSFFPFLVLCCGICGLMFLLLLPILWRALLRRPAIVVSGGVLTVYSNCRKTATIADITDVQPFCGSALIKFSNGRSFAAPVIICQHPSRMLRYLQALACSQSRA
jgi:hypothetical protein